MTTTTDSTVQIALSLDAAHRAHFLALASAGRASLAYARRLVHIRTADHADYVRALPCGDQDAEFDRTESLRTAADFAWSLAESLRASIVATQPKAYHFGWGCAVLGTAKSARFAVEAVQNRRDTNALPALVQLLQIVEENLDAACADYEL